MGPGATSGAGRALCCSLWTIGFWVPWLALPGCHRGAGGHRRAATASLPPTEEADRGNEGSGRGAAASSQAACLGGRLPENVTIGSVTRRPLPFCARARVGGGYAGHSFSWNHTGAATRAGRVHGATLGWEWEHWLWAIENAARGHSHITVCQASLRGSSGQQGSPVTSG